MRPQAWLVKFTILCEDGVWRRDGLPSRKKADAVSEIRHMKRNPNLYRNVRGPFPMVLAETKAKPKPADKRLRVKFALKGRTLTAQVLEMPERLRGGGQLWWDRGYAINSAQYPALCDFGRTLYLQGYDRDRDRETAHRVFAPETIAAAALAAFRRGVADINRRLAKGEL